MSLAQAAPTFSMDSLWGGGRLGWGGGHIRAFVGLLPSWEGRRVLVLSSGPFVVGSRHGDHETTGGGVT